ncbi:MAG: alpha/beta hydrolase [Flavobacteriales bacterium]
MKHDISQEIDWNGYNFKAEKIDLTVEDSISLDSYLVLPKEDSVKGIIIMVHGIGSCKEPYSNLSEKLAELKIGTLLFDLRAHGKSGGEYCTYGAKEKQDIKEIVSFLKNKYPNTPVGIWGASLGGAIAIQALELDKRIEFGLIECTFTELDQIVYDYQKRILFGIGFRFMTDRALKKAGEIANFNPEEVKPINSVKNITQPVLIAHGDKDENISYEYGEMLFDSLKSSYKVFVPVAGAGHNYLHKIGGIDYEEEVLRFIEEELE